MFRCLARTCADRSAGRAGTVGSRPTWRRAYRAPERRQVRARRENAPSWLPDEVRQFGQTFAELQGERRLAEYNPDYRVGKSDADINDAQTAINRFLATPRQRSARLRRAEEGEMPEPVGGSRSAVRNASAAVPPSENRRKAAVAAAASR